MNRARRAAESVILGLLRSLELRGPIDTIGRRTPKAMAKLHSQVLSALRAAYDGDEGYGAHRTVYAEAFVAWLNGDDESAVLAIDALEDWSDPDLALSLLRASEGGAL